MFSRRRDDEGWIPVVTCCSALHWPAWQWRIPPSAHPELQHALLAATLLGSHAPDFDAIMRLQGPSAYIRHHRGITRSLPAPFVWSPLIGLPICWLFGAGAWSGTVLLWTFIAVCFHIILDLFNGYGVQCLRPFSKKWLHLDVLSLFDPYLFTAHGVAALLWLFGFDHVALVFQLLYALTVMYLAWRIVIYRKVIHKLRKIYGLKKGSITIPLTPWYFLAVRRRSGG